MSEERWGARGAGGGELHRVRAGEHKRFCLWGGCVREDALRVRSLIVEALQEYAALGVGVGVLGCAKSATVACGCGLCSSPAAAAAAETDMTAAAGRRERPGRARHKHAVEPVVATLL